MANLLSYNGNVTVLVAINTRDAIVLAADSQGTVTRPLVDPKDLSEFFDTDSERRLRTGSDGRPILDTWSRIASHTMELPYKVHTQVEKIFSLEPLKMGVMASGIGSIGDRTIKSLLNEFKTIRAFSSLNHSEYNLENTAVLLLDFLSSNYAKVYPCGGRHEMELMLCGYEKGRFTPGVVRIRVHERAINEPDFDFCIFFGGITREIQRILFGIDSVSKTRLIKRGRQLLETYREQLGRYLSSNNISIELPEPEPGGELSLFYNVDLDSLQMNCATYSERDAIECADFLVNVMIKSQRFSNQVPSTGGDVQIAIIRKHSGFEFITSRQPYLRGQSGN